MPNIAVLLRKEITRLANKEIRSQAEALRKTLAVYRKKIAEMKRQVSDLQRKVTSLEKQVHRNILSTVGEPDTKSFRFSSRGLRSNRKRLGLSASNYGKIIGVTGQTVYKWEQEVSRPREQQIAALAKLRGMGKKEAQERLEELTKTGP